MFYNLLPHTRRPDITFLRNGRIRITARLARILSLHPGDSINIARCDDGAGHIEYLLHAFHTNGRGRHQAQCYPTKKGSNNYCANSAHLCCTLLSALHISADKASFMVGESFTRGNTIYVPIVTKHPL